MRITSHRVGKRPTESVRSDRALDENGSSELVGPDLNFQGAFASNGGSSAPTKILKLKGIELQTVSNVLAYRQFQLQQLRDMEAHADDEINGYLAGWVAQKAVVGQIEDGWQTMLGKYRRSSARELTQCSYSFQLSNCDLKEDRPRQDYRD